MTEVMTATSTEVQNNFGRYLAFVIDGSQIVITKNGRKVARVVPESQAAASLTDSLTGILKRDYAAGTEKEGALKAKYEGIG